MPRGSARSTGSSGENILHWNAIRIRVNGTGALKMRLFSLDDIRSKQMVDVSMSMLPGRHHTVLANFLSERVSLEIQTNNINDFFRINRIILFSRFHATSYPQ